jgi:FkbH-like protein
MHDFVEASWVDLTSRQRSIWLDISASGDHRLFQVGACVKVVQELDLALLRDALSDVVRRHDALRLTIDPDQPRQRVQRAWAATVRMIDFSNEANADQAALEYIDQLFASPFHLDEKPLFQFVVARVGPKSCWLVLRVHHIVTDAIAFSITLKDIIVTYNSLSNGVSGERPRSSYLQFQKQDAIYCASPRFERDLAYWQKRLDGLPEALFAQRTNHEDVAGNRPLVRQEIDFARYQQFLSQCAAQNIRPANAFFALSAWLLTSARGRDELILGVAYPGRTKEDKNSVGIFSGVMPLRVKVPAGLSLPELATNVTQSIRRDYLHHRTPIDDIRRNLGADQRHRETLIDAMVSYTPLDIADLDIELGKERLTTVVLRGPEASPLAIYISEVNSYRPIALEFSYNRKYLQDGQVAAIADCFSRLFDAFIDDPQASMLHVDRVEDHGANETVTDDTTDLPNPSMSDGSYQLRIVSTFTSAPIESPLQFWLQRTGIESSISFADYNQVFQELLDPESSVRRNRRGVNVILLRLQDWLREREESSCTELDTQFLAKVADDFMHSLAQAARASDVPYLLLICPPSPEWDSDGTRAKLQELLLQKVEAGLADTPNLDVTTYRMLRELYPIDTEYDPTGDQLGHLPYTTSAFAAMATLVARRAHLMLRSPVKVIAVDCDNTLWDGVVGEDGPHGIRISEYHRFFQGKLVEAAKCGVLICLCSKNIEADVTAVFQNRSDMVLKPEHIVGSKINWRSKSENIRELAKELNVGLDSFLFLDDNPIELAEVASACPEVVGIQINSSQTETTKLDHIWPLDCRQSTAEDAKRVESYRHNFLRTRERENANDFSSFIAGLDLQIRLENPNDHNLARLAQLTERTNQFNINNEKRSGAALAEQSATKGNAVLAVRVADKFGDYGIVGLLSVRSEGKDLLVDTFLMSCRVLGRGVEHRMISEIGRLALECGASSVRIPVRFSDRNLPVRRFLEGIDGQHDVRAGDQLHVLSPEVAAECCFRPDLQTAVAGESTSATISLNRVGRVNAAIWIETATTLASVPEIEKAVHSAGIGEGISQEISRAPQTRTEQVLTELFCQALGLAAIGADDDFFDLGVHSLLAVQLVSRIRDQFNFQLSIRTLFECSTIAKLAEAIEQQNATGYQPLVPLQIGDDAPALFCCHPANGDAVCYMRLTKAIGPDQSVYGFEASGLSPGEPMARSVEEMARTYVKEMIAVQPQGPYHLLGWSYGGALAFEMARQVHAAGGKVGLLSFMDAVAPEMGLPAAQREEVSEQKLLEGITRQLNTLLRYSKLPPRSETGRTLTWEEVIDGFQSMGIVPGDYSVEEMRRKMVVYGNCNILFNQYRPTAIPFPIVHFQATQNLEEWNFDWSPYTASQVRRIWIRCNHFRMGFEPNTKVIAAHLRSIIRADKSALAWWRRVSFAISAEALIDRFTFKRN